MFTPFYLAVCPEDKNGLKLSELDTNITWRSIKRTWRQYKQKKKEKHENRSITSLTSIVWGKTCWCLASTVGEERPTSWKVLVWFSFEDFGVMLTFSCSYLNKHSSKLKKIMKKVYTKKNIHVRAEGKKAMPSLLLILMIWSGGLNISPQTHQACLRYEHIVGIVCDYPSHSIGAGCDKYLLGTQTVLKKQTRKRKSVQIILLTRHAATAHLHDVAMVTATSYLGLKYV